MTLTDLEEETINELAASFEKIQVTTLFEPGVYKDDNDIVFQNTNSQLKTHSLTLDKGKARELSPFVLESMSLFPEWYYYFKRNFMKLSTLANLYCVLDFGEFKSRSGLASLLNSYFNLYQDAFSAVVHFHIDKFLSEEETKMELSRYAIENEMWDKLRGLPDDLRLQYRREYLCFLMARGDCIPLCHHLIAYGYTTQKLWDYIFGYLELLLEKSEMRQVLKLQLEYISTDPLAKAPELFLFLKEKGYIMEVPGKSSLKRPPPRGSFVLTRGPIGLEPLKSDFVTVHRNRAKMGPPEGYTDRGPTPSLGMDSLRLMLAYAASNKMLLRQLQIDAAYLSGDGMEGTIDSKKRLIFRLDKTFYGTKMAFYIWYDTISSGLKLHGFEQKYRDQCLFTRGEGSNMVIVGLHFQNLIVIVKDMASFESLMLSLFNSFEVKDLGRPSTLLRMNLEFENDQVKITMKDRIQQLAKEVIRPEEEPYKSLFEPEKKESLEKSCPTTPYVSLVRKLHHISKMVRFDVSFIIAALWRHVSFPKFKHLHAAFQVVRYLEKTADFGLVYGPDRLSNLYAYSNSRVASTNSDNRYLTSSILQYGGSPISWKTNLQSSRTFTDTEAEIMALSLVYEEVEGIAEAIQKWPIDVAYHIFTSNAEANSAVKSSTAFEGRKRFAEKVDYIRKVASLPDFSQELIDDTDNLARVLTQTLEEDESTRLCEKITGKEPMEWYGSVDVSFHECKLEPKSEVDSTPKATPEAKEFDAADEILVPEFKLPGSFPDWDVESYPDTPMATDDSDANLLE